MLVITCVVAAVTAVTVPVCTAGTVSRENTAGTQDRKTIYIPVGQDSREQKYQTYLTAPTESRAQSGSKKQ